MNASNDNVNALQALSDALVSLVGRVAPSVVSVSAQNSQGRSFAMGSGILWDQEGYVVTNNHVLGHRSTSRAQVGLSSGETLPANVVGRDADTDLTLLKLEAGKAGSPIELGSAQQLKVGQWVLAVANAFGAEPSATAGIVTSSRRSLRAWGGQHFENVVMSDARVNPGYSGGPLVDSSGKMVALNTAYAFSRTLSIPVETVREVVEKLKKYGRVKHAFLGVVLDPIELSEEATDLKNATQDSGLLVLSVSRESPARAAGVAVGDIVVGFNGNQVSNYPELRKMLDEEAIGKKSQLAILRGGKTNLLEIVPSEDVA